MTYKMKGFSGFGNSPAKQTKFPDSEATKKVRKARQHKKNLKVIDSISDEGWDNQAKMIKPGNWAKKKSPAKQKENKYNLEEEQVADISGPRRKVVGPATSERKFEGSELINDLEDKIEFINNDITEGKVSKAEGSKLIAGYETKIAKLR